MELCLAVDIGGTKLAAGVVDRQGTLHRSAQVATPATSDPEALFSALAALVDRIVAEVAGPDRLVACGIGCGGPMAPGGEEVSPLNIPAWRGFPLRRRMAQHTELECGVDNDAKALALGEGWRGAALGERDFIAMVVSTGVGGGIVLDGRLLQGTGGNAGHIGHVVVDPEDGPECGCGGHGCLEAIARGPALVQWAQAEGWRPEHKDATAKELAGDAALGHQIATAAMRRAGQALGVAIASATCLCDLEVVSVGGGLSQAGTLLFDPLEEALRAHTRLGFTRAVSVVPAGLGQNAGLVGAASLIFAADRYWAGD
jgi:glucokinase